MAVDFSVPLFRTRAVVAVYDHPLLVCEPALKLGFLGPLGGFDPLAVRGFQYASMSSSHCRNARRRSSGARAQTQSNP